MAARLFIAKQLYEANCAAFGGRDSQGDPLPTWASLVANPDKHPVVNMWVAAADRSIAQQPVRERSAPGGWG